MMVWKFIHVALLASIKYLFTLPYALLIGMEYKEAVFAVILGGVGGFFFFYYLSGWIIKEWKRAWHVLCRMVPLPMRRFLGNECTTGQKKRTAKISKKSRGIVKLRKRYGFWGIIIATPVLLSIPLGAFLANKYYHKKNNLVLYMTISIVAWGAIISGAVSIFSKTF